MANWMWATRDAALYEIASIARILVERSDRITVEMARGAAESDMRAYLFGLGFGTLVHMRGLIPLHISAIKAPDGVVAFTGASGAGKSTKVAELHFKHGWPIICDDVAVLHPSDDRPLLHAGMNRIKLWKDAVERLGMDPSKLRRDLTREDKFHLLAPEMFAQEPFELKLMIEIGKGARKVDSLAKEFVTLTRAIYRPEIGYIFNDHKRSFFEIGKLAHHVSTDGFATEFL